MKTNPQLFGYVLGTAFIVAAIGTLDSSTLRAADSKSSSATATATVGTDDEVKVQELDPLGERERKPLPWLGLATEETTEALNSQLGLDPGVGLTVTYVAPEGPAAKAGLQKNDVVVDIDGQPLVHPAQLRKLVQVRKPGDAVKLAYYRAGKKSSVSLTLIKAPRRNGWFDEERSMDVRPEFQGFQDQFRGLNGAFREKMKTLQQSLGELRIDSEDVQKEIRRSISQARKAAQDAMRHATNEFGKLGPSVKILEELARGQVNVNEDATVTVKSSGSSVKTMVKADDSGTYVLLANPRKHLTVHDQDGKLLFDGEIETPEQQAAVPKDIWPKVEPMVNKIGAPKEKVPELE